MATDPQLPEPDEKDLYKRDLLNYLLGGIICFGLIGWGLDYLLHTGWFITVGGALLGAGGGVYLAHQHRLERLKARGENGNEKHH